MPKRASIEFASGSEIERVSLRFGGEPYGLPESLWPVSQRGREPMQFICHQPKRQGGEVSLAMLLSLKPNKMGRSHTHTIDETLRILRARKQR